MSACNAEWNEKLSAWFDGEASQAERTEVTLHLQTCAACSESHASFQRIRSAVRAVPSPGISPERVRSRLRAAGRGRHMRWMAAAAAVVIVSVGAMFLRRQMEDGGFVREVEAQHLKGFAHGRPCEFESSDPKAVEQWIATNVAQSIAVPEVPGATLLGARRCSLGGEPTLALVYQSEGKGLTVFVPPAGSETASCAAALANGGSRCTTGAMGEQICATSRTNRAAVAVGDDERTVLLASAAVMER